MKKDSKKMLIITSILIIFAIIIVVCMYIARIVIESKDEVEEPENTANITTNNTEEDTNTDIKNPDTGSNIPFMIIGCGSLGAIIIYEIASTRKKLHKI